MNSHHKLFYCTAAVATVCLCSCNNRKTEKSAVNSADTLEIMTRPFESAREVKISKPGTFSEAYKTKNTAQHAQLTAVKILQMDGYGQDSSFAKKAATLLENVINSDAFETTVLNNTYTENNNLSPEEIYNKIMQGHETLRGGRDSVIGLRLRVINLLQDGAVWLNRCEPGSSSGTIGIDGGGTGVAAVCPQWLRSTAQENKPSWLAAHFIHEYMHILGFKHYRRKSTSVPYKIQFIVEQLGAQYDAATPLAILRH